MAHMTFLVLLANWLALNPRYILSCVRKLLSLYQFPLKVAGKGTLGLCCRVGAEVRAILPTSLPPAMLPAIMIHCYYF